MLRSKRWRDPTVISSAEEAQAYARLARSRGDAHNLFGEFAVTFGGALMGSVALDFFAQGPDASSRTKVGFLAAFLIIAAGQLASRIRGASWTVLSNYYGTLFIKNGSGSRSRKGPRATAVIRTAEEIRGRSRMRRRPRC